MAMIEKKAVDTVASTHEISRSKAAPVAEPIEETEVESEEPAVDYKAELEKEMARRKKAEFTLYKKNVEEKKAKVQEVPAKAAPSSIREEIAQVLEEQRMQDASEAFEEELFSITENEDERELIRHKYENSLVKSGFSRAAIRQDLEDAKFLANKPKYQREQNEIAKTLVSKRTVSNSGVGASQEKPRPSEDLSKHFTKGDWQFIKDQGFTKDQIKKIIENRK